MDKQSVIAILKEYFQTEGNIVYLQLVDGYSLFVNHLPNFFSFHMNVIKAYQVKEKLIKEVVCVPYSSIMYITLSNSENLKIINNEYEHLNDVDADKLIDEINKKTV